MLAVAAVIYSLLHRQRRPTANIEAKLGTPHRHRRGGDRRVAYSVRRDALRPDGDTGQGHGLCRGGLAAAFLLIIAIRRKLAAKLSVAVLASLVVLALAEGSIGILMAPRERDFAWYVSPLNHKIHVQPTNLIGIASDGAFSTNSHGLRGPEFSKDDDYRILCIGGSTTECLYLDDRAALPALLADGLNGEDERVWVGNAGRAGLNSYDHIVIVKHLPEARQVVSGE